MPIQQQAQISQTTPTWTSLAVFQNITMSFIRMDVTLQIIIYPSESEYCPTSLALLQLLQASSIQTARKKLLGRRQILPYYYLTQTQSILIMHQVKSYQKSYCVNNVCCKYYFGQQCKKSTMVNCAQTYFSNNNISTEGIDTCVENSFEEGEEVNQEIRTNKILNQYKELQYNQTSFSVHLDSSDITNTPYDEFLSTMCSKYINISISFCKNIEKPNKQTDNGNTLEQVFLFFFALIILILTASGGWTLLSKIQFGSSLVPKSRIAIPKLEGDHIIQEDDI